MVVKKDEFTQLNLHGHRGGKKEMRKRQGFTLIELLAVIVILAIIALIATPVILNIIEKAKISAAEDSVYGAMEAIKLSYTESLLDVTPKTLPLEVKCENGTCNNDVKISGTVPEGTIKLLENGRFEETTVTVNGISCTIADNTNIVSCESGSGETEPEEEEKKPTVALNGQENITVNQGSAYTDEGITATDPEGKTLEPTIEIKKGEEVVSSVDTTTAGTYMITYTVTYNGKEYKLTRKVTVLKSYTEGEVVIFDPGDGESTTWNVISQTSDTVTIMLNKNLGSRVSWQDSGANADGPVGALAVLNARTADWTNVPEISSYEYVNNAGGNTWANGYQKVTITNGTAVVTKQNGGTTTVSGTSRARLITGQEVADIMNDTAWNQNTYTGNAYVPDWLKANLSSNNTSLPTGYWTLSTYAGSNECVWHTFYTDFLVYSGARDSSSRGVRPVITISKTLLNS